MLIREFKKRFWNDQKDFDNIELSGNFINDHLKGVHFNNCTISGDFTGANLRESTFENCRFTNCCFNYADFEGSTFKENTFKGTQFKYTRYENLLFENNFYNNISLTKTFLDSSRYPNHIGFHITEISAGWFDIFIGDSTENAVVTASYCYGNMAPYLLLDSLIDFNETPDTKLERLFYWSEEPGGFVWKMENINDNLQIKIYFTRADFIYRYIDYSTPIDEDDIYKLVFTSECSLNHFTHEVISSFDKIKTLEKNRYFEDNWGPFPTEKVKKLKSFLF